MVIVLTALLLAIGSSDTLDDAEFRKLHQQLQPNENELWRSIPWTVSLLEGQRKAASTGKPLFIWAMDGHPLGCT